VPQRQLQSTSSLRPTSSDQQDREEGVDGLDELDELGSCDSVSTVKDREVTSNPLTFWGQWRAKGGKFLLTG
jgi:hypothetical protein